jgi:hypothetical protein
MEEPTTLRILPREDLPEGTTMGCKQRRKVQAYALSPSVEAKAIDRKTPPKQS